MNSEMLQGKWKQIKGSVKETFGKLTDDDMLQIEGSMERGVGLLQQRYGYTKERAQQEWDNFLNKSNQAARSMTNSAADSIKAAVDSAKEKAKV